MPLDTEPKYIYDVFKEPKKVDVYISEKCLLLFTATRVAGINTVLSFYFISNIPVDEPNAVPIV